MKLKETIEAAWDDRAMLADKSVQNAIHEVVDQLDQGILRVAQKEPDGWKVNDWIKKQSSSISPSEKWKPLRHLPLSSMIKSP